MNAGLPDPVYTDEIGTRIILKESCYIECMHGSVGFLTPTGRVRWLYHATERGEITHLRDEGYYGGTIHRIVPEDEVTMLLLGM